MKLIPWAALAGFVIAMPLSWLIASNLAAAHIEASRRVGSTPSDVVNAKR